MVSGQIRQGLKRSALYHGSPDKVNDKATHWDRESWKRHSPDPFEFAVTMNHLSRDVEINDSWINGSRTSKKVK